MKRSFFDQNSVRVAKELLGCYLIHESIEGKTIGKIVETEAYHDQDEASHSFSGKTPRTEVMFGPSGHAYIYFVYGMYFCFNVVTDKKDKGSAVLIRALEPLEGIEVMKKRRKKENILDLCSGPAKLVMAMGIKKEQNGHDLTKKPLYITQAKHNSEVVITKRIGISKAIDAPYRFYLKDNKFVSKK